MTRDLMIVAGGGFGPPGPRPRRIDASGFEPATLVHAHVVRDVDGDAVVRGVRR